MSNSRYQNVYPFSIMFAYPGEPITLYVFEILRLGRSFLGMLNMAPSLEESGTRIWSLSPTESRSRIDDTKLRDLMSSIFSLGADRERGNLIERTKTWYHPGEIGRGNARQAKKDHPVETGKGFTGEIPLRQFPGFWILLIQHCTGIIRNGRSGRKS